MVAAEVSYVPARSHPWRKIVRAEVSEARNKPRQPRRHLEDGECMALMGWAMLKPWKVGTVSDHLRHIPNGGRREPREAARLKRMGVTPGTPDYFLSICCSGFGGLWIEMKIPASPGQRAGAVSADQKTEIEKLIANGYRVEVCYGWQAAADVIADYLDIKRAAR